MKTAGTSSDVRREGIEIPYMKLLMEDRVSPANNIKMSVKKKRKTTENIFAETSHRRLPWF